MSVSVISLSTEQPLSTYSLGLILSDGRVEAWFVVFNLHRLILESMIYVLVM